ncbi:type II toxin-antitoxin system RelE/ParE family toxin [candidate division KSB1 bacterium]|nr:type II toxin-antitoxin system RelE/ParE family toxin [candidate division KSB1 bacterium]
MQFIEAPIFTRRLKTLLTEEEYRELQNELIKRPEAGAVIRGSGGLRKLRWSVSGRGKRGGVRVIYYWFLSQEQFLMLFIYPKSEQDDLTPEQMKRLKAIVEQELKNARRIV